MRDGDVLYRSEVLRQVALGLWFGEGQGPLLPRAGGGGIELLLLRVLHGFPLTTKSEV